MPPLTIQLVTDPAPARLHVQADSPTTATTYSIDICARPTCHCHSVTLRAESTTTTTTELPAELFLDPFDRVAFTIDHTDLPPPAQAIAAAISRDDWTRLADHFLAVKANAFATVDPNHERAQFPFEEVEHGSLMVRLHDIFPFAPDLGTTNEDGRTIMVNEHHCVEPVCPCTKVVLDLEFAASEDDSAALARLPALEVDWLRGRWRVSGKHCGLLPAESALRDRLLAAHPDLLEELGRRQKLLRRLYEVSRPKHLDTVRQTPVRAAAKTGRNDPCPCGSGRKYKKCCLPKDAPAAD